VFFADLISNLTIHSSGDTMQGDIWVFFLGVGRGGASREARSTVYRARI